MLFTGDLIDAKTALAWGLVNRVAPPPGSMPRWTSSRARSSRTARRGEPGQAILLRPGGERTGGRLFLASEGMACNMMLEDAAKDRRFIRSAGPTGAGARERAGREDMRRRSPATPQSTQQRPTTAFFAPRWAKPGRGERMPKRLRATWWKPRCGRAGPCSSAARLRDISAGISGGRLAFPARRSLAAHPRPAFPDRNARGPCPALRGWKAARALPFASVAMDAIGGNSSTRRPSPPR